MLLPAPGRYLSAPFNLTSHIEFRVATGATLLASTAVAEWPVVAPLPSYGAGVENTGNMSGRHAAFIGGAHLRNVTMSGGGTIDGQGEVWWFRSGRLPGHNKTLIATRGRLVEPMYCEDFTLRDLTLKERWVRRVFEKSSWPVVKKTRIT